MSSGQWEVVGKGKKDKHVANGKPRAKDDKKKTLLENGPKLEDILPPSQIKSLYAAMEAEEEKKGKENKKKDTETKKPQQPKKQATEKKPDPPKPKLPKSIEAAFQSIEINEIASVITSNKTRFSNAPLVWLKELASYLNSKTGVDVNDPVFTSQSVNYPLCVVPQEVKKIIEGVLQEAGKANAQLFYDITLTSLANDMSRGQSAIGHKVLLQMIGQEYPEFCVASIQKSASLRNSYQNRPPIGLSLLWAFGQGGFKNLTIGLQAWQELILPLIDLRNYSKYVITYLSKLLDRHLKMETKVTQEQYLSMVDVVGSKRSGLTKDLSSDLIVQLTKIRKMYLQKNAGKLQVTFNQLLKKLPNQYIESKNLDQYQREIVDTLIECLERDDTCNATWKQLFQKCTRQTATLLDVIESNWKGVSTRINVKSLNNTLIYFKTQSVELLNTKKKDEAVVKVDKLIQEIISKKMAKRSRGFPWLLASFFVFLGIIGLVVYDVSLVGGNFPKSTTGKLLNDLGILEQSQTAWKKAMSASARGYIWVEQTTPIYYAQVSEFSKPYLQLGKDFYLVALKQTSNLYGNIKNYALEKAPVVQSTVDQYAPGLLESIEGYARSGWGTVCKYSSEYYNATVTYLHTKVFVGDWAPEILQNKTLNALNSTKIYVSQYYTWFHNQVDIYSKIQ